MTLPVWKRSVKVGGRNTSVSMEEEFWNALTHIAKSNGSTIAALVSVIDRDRDAVNLSSACRVYTLRYFRSREQT